MCYELGGETHIFDNNLLVIALLGDKLAYIKPPGFD